MTNARAGIIFRQLTQRLAFARQIIRVRNGLVFSNKIRVLGANICMLVNIHLSCIFEI